MLLVTRSSKPFSKTYYVSDVVLGAGSMMWRKMVKSWPVESWECSSKRDGTLALTKLKFLVGAGG